MILQADKLAATGGTAVRVSERFWQSNISTKGIFPAQEPNPQTLLIPPPFYKFFQVLFCVRPTFYVSNSMVKNV